MTMIAIETIHLEKTYAVGFWRKKPRVALRPLDLTVEEGEIFGFLGPNGAGKTTTLKLLMGLVFPTAGSARILGIELDDPRMKAQIGFLPEQPYFYDHLTARELLNYYGQLSGVPAKERSARVERMLARVGSAIRRECNCGNSPRACCSGWAWRRRFCTIRKWSFSMSRCRDWIPWDAAKFAT